jgi:hypothetical protein
LSNLEVHNFWNVIKPFWDHLPFWQWYALGRGMDVDSNCIVARFCGLLMLEATSVIYVQHQENVAVGFPSFVSSVKLTKLGKPGKLQSSSTAFLATVHRLSEPLASFTKLTMLSAHVEAV